MALIDNCILYLKFDGNADDSVGSNDGTVIGSAPNSSSYGKINEGYSMNGTSQGITIGTQIDINNYSDWSVSGWHYVPAVTTGVSIAFMFGTSNDSNYYMGLMYKGSDELWDLLDRTTNSRRVTYDDSGAAKGNWNHIVVTYDSTTYKLYINGSYKTSLSQTISTNINTFAVGMLDRNTDYFGGGASYNDEYGIWDVVLSSTEVSELYNGGSGLQYPFSATGWTGKINNVTNPAKVNGIAVANISTINEQ